MTRLTGASPAIVAALTGLAEQDKLSDEHVLAAAVPKDSPLHGCFTWDNTAAAHAHRLNQAQDLIRRIKITIEPEPDSDPIKVRAFIPARDITGTQEQGRYVGIETLQETDSQMWLGAIRRDLDRLRRKYSDSALFLEALRAYELSD